MSDLCTFEPEFSWFVGSNEHYAQPLALQVSLTNNYKILSKCDQQDKNTSVRK